MKHIPDESGPVGQAAEMVDTQSVPTLEGAHDDQTPADETSVPPLPPRRVPRQFGAYAPLADALEIGDPGRQREVVPVHGPLCVGVSDTELDFCTVDPFEVRACSTRGASHRHAGTPRQDAFCSGSDEVRLVLCVADGVSQGKHSQVAAETAARAACKLVLDTPVDSGEIDWTVLANRISRRILDEARYRRLADLTEGDVPAEQIRVVQRAMSTTAIVAVVSRVEDQSGLFPFVVAVLAGDSGAYVLDAGTWTAVAGGKGGVDSAITDGAVHPLPGLAAPVVFRSSLSLGQVLLLTSDGVGDPLGDGSGAVGKVLADRWAEPPTAVQFFADVNFLRRSYDDDRTAVGVWVLPLAEQRDA